MLANLLEYHWAEDIDEAVLLLSRTDIKTVPLAGGTYLLGQPDTTIQAVVDLRDLELTYISEDTRGVHIGAMTTLQDMVDAPLLKELTSGILSRAAQFSSFSRLIRNNPPNTPTLGAGIASQADLLTALAVVDAEVIVRSGSQTLINLRGGTSDRPGLELSGITYKGKQERRIPFKSLLETRRPQELIIETIIPRPGPNCGASFQRIGRTSTDVALLNGAALIEISDGIYKRVRLALGGVNMEPIRFQALEQQIEGQPVIHPSAWAQYLVPKIQEAMTEFRPPSDFRATHGYRRVSGRNLAFRVLEEAAGISYWRSIVSSEGRA